MSNVKVKRYVVELTKEDEVRACLRIRGERLMHFALNYRTVMEEAWREVVRYDTAHGRLHVHRFWLPQGRQVQALEDRRRPMRDYAPALAQVRRDLLANWSAYRTALEVAHPWR